MWLAMMSMPVGADGRGGDVSRVVARYRGVVSVGGIGLQTEPITLGMRRFMYIT